MTQIKLENVTTNDTARKEEVLAYLICQEYIFGDKSCFIGDDSNCPDIYTKDKQTGAEVVVCESYDTFNKISKTKLGNINRQNKLPKDYNKKNIYLYKKHTELNVDIDLGMTPQQEFELTFQNALESKLDNLNGNSYTSCKQNNLIVLSCFKNKSFAKDEIIFDLCKNTMKNYKKQYENIFVVINQKVLAIDKDQNCKLLKDLSKTKQTELVF